MYVNILRVSMLLHCFTASLLHCFIASLADKAYPRPAYYKAYPKRKHRLQTVSKRFKSTSNTTFTQRLPNVHPASNESFTQPLQHAYPRLPNAYLTPNTTLTHRLPTLHSRSEFTKYGFCHSLKSAFSHLSFTIYLRVLCCLV